jgi:cell division protein FtsN
MSKEEQFEHIENKIKQAIEGDQPAYDEKAWAKMEGLLDKDEKKRRPFLWLAGALLLLVIAAGSTYYFSTYQHNRVSDTVKTISPLTTKTKSTAPGGIIEETIEKNSDQIAAKVSKKDNEQLDPSAIGKPVAGFQINKNGNNATQPLIKKRKRAVTFNNANKIADEKEDKQMHLDKKNITDNGRMKITTQGNEPEEITGVNEGNKEEVKNVTVSAINNEKDSISSLIKKVTENTDSNSAKATAQKKQTAKAEKKSSSFYFLISLGADAGGVKLFSYKNSSIGARYGLGIGYQLNRKLSFQTGFYAGKKIYSAGPGDYQVKAGSYWNYVTLTKVDAACMIYEIPITARYNFLQKSSLAYYTTIGLSSYLMKKEDYNYYYTRYNIPAEKYYSYTGNKHLFSTLSISAGIEKKISGGISLQLEPSVSLPLSGVGDGAVKLYSTAIMLGLKYVPSKKLKNKNLH